MKNFLLSFLIVVLAFVAGGYLLGPASPFALFSTPPAPAAAPLNVRTENVAAGTSPSNAGTGGELSDDEASIYTPEELHTIRLFENASPSVCYITTKTRQRSFWSFDVTEVPSGSGSGFVWDQDGHIITNYHVIKGATQAIVTLGNGNSYQASLVGVAKEKDLAVLKIEAPKGELPPIPVGNSENIRVGQNVYAIGNPFGLDQTLTTGVVSALDREINSQAGVPIRGVIQSDAAINPGNSGGPLLDSRGLLIGVNTAIYSPSGASAGIGFSIPVDVVRYVIPDLIRYGEVRRASLDANLRQLNRYGLMFNEINNQGVADRAGIRGLRRDANGRYVMGDILAGINGEPIRSYSDYYLEMEKYAPGDVVELNLLRNEQPLTVSVKLGSSVD